MDREKEEIYARSPIGIQQIDRALLVFEAGMYCIGFGDGEPETSRNICSASVARSFSSRPIDHSAVLGNSRAAALLWFATECLRDKCACRRACPE
jgi:hypothetical protein